MDIQKEREALIAEINNFKKEALKMHIVEVLANTYEHSSLFDCNIDVDGSVIWYKAQARQLWDFWQAAKAQAVPEGFVLVPKEPTPKMIYATWNFDDEIQNMSHNSRNEFIYKTMIEAQEQSHDVYGVDMKNMKIPVENNLDEIVAELERFWYEKVGWIGYRNAYFITTNAKGQFTDHAVSLMNCLAYCQLTTLAELKGMKNESK